MKTGKAFDGERRARYLAIGLAMLFVSAAFAFESTSWIGKGDLDNPFGDPQNFGRWESVDGKPTYVNRLPQAGWRVFVEKDAPPLYIRDDDAAFASSLMDLYMYGTVYWAVSTNCVMMAKLAGTGEFIKLGNDTTLQFADGGQWSYNAHYTVAEGVLKLQNFVGQTCPYNVFVSGHCTVSNGATLVICNADSEVNTSFEQLICHGLVTNENASVRHVITTRASNGERSLMAGDLGGKLILRIGSGDFDITSTNNTFTSFFPRSGVLHQTVVGIMKFGNKGEPTSSIGPTETLASEVGAIAGGSALFRYLGTGETTDKTLELKLDSKWAEMVANPPSGFDGGPHGGAIFTGEWKSSSEHFQILRLTGSNSVPCQYSGIFSIKSANGIRYAPHILKDGTGVWRFNETDGRSGVHNIGLTGAFSVEEGTLQFDSLGEVGENCALGTAGDLYDKHIGAYDATKKVDWAYSFGTTNETGAAAKEGTLEFVGTETAFASRRKISLLGNGRLKNSGSAALALRGVSARVAGEHAITLDGANTMTNAVAEVSDGVAGAHVSVVKEGGGTWWLKGNTTFSGDIVVKAGELSVEANTNRFNWFRITFRKCGSSFNQLVEIAFYDKDGVRQNIGLKRPASAPSGSPVRVRHQCCDLLPGELYYGCSYTTAYQQGSAPMESVTDDKSNTAGIFQYLATPNEEVAFTWVPAVMRLKDTANEIAAFDLCTAWALDRLPSSFLVEGSQDGLNWQVLTNMPHGSFTVPTEYYTWYSDNLTFVAGETRKVSERHGFAIAGHPEVSALPNVRSVRVDTGATLKTEYENVGEIRGLKVAAAGGGTIDGFRFAANGSVDLVDIPPKATVEMPIAIVNDGGTKANVGRWPITINGEAPTRQCATFTGSMFRVTPRGVVISVR